MFTAQQLIERNKQSQPADFIDQAQLQSLVDSAAEPSASQLEKLMAKAEKAKGLSTEEVASLLAVEDPDKLICSSPQLER